jgi:hypothetical protein
MVLRLIQSLYCLEKYSHVWYSTFKHFVISIEFMASPVDGELFKLHSKDAHSTVVAAVILYIDDLLTIDNEGLIGQIKDQIEDRLRMHDLGCISCYLSMNIECNRSITQSPSISTAPFPQSWRSSELMSPELLPRQWR